MEDHLTVHALNDFLGILSFFNLVPVKPHDEREVVVLSVLVDSILNFQVDLLVDFRFLALRRLRWRLFLLIGVRTWSKTPLLRLRNVLSA